MLRLSWAVTKSINILQCNLAKADPIPGLAKCYKHYWQEFITMERKIRFNEVRSDISQHISFEYCSCLRQAIDNYFFYRHPLAFRSKAARWHVQCTANKMIPSFEGPWNLSITYHIPYIIDQEQSRLFLGLRTKTLSSFNKTRTN